MVKKIGNGLDTSLWYDNWIKNCSLLDMTGLQHPLHSQRTGLFLIFWKMEWHMKLSTLQQVWNTILTVKPDSGRDTWLWTEKDTRTHTVFSLEFCQVTRYCFSFLQTGLDPFCISQNVYLYIKSFTKQADYL